MSSGNKNTYRPERLAVLPARVAHALMGYIAQWHDEKLTDFAPKDIRVGQDFYQVGFTPEHDAIFVIIEPRKIQRETIERAIVNTRDSSPTPLNEEFANLSPEEFEDVMAAQAELAQQTDRLQNETTRLESELKNLPNSTRHVIWKREAMATYYAISAMVPSSIVSSTKQKAPAKPEEEPCPSTNTKPETESESSDTLPPETPSPTKSESESKDTAE